MDRVAANAVVRDPQADPALLAQVAHEHPELQPAVAAHPGAYEGLLAWLETMGDPAVDFVLATRAGAPQPAVTQPLGASALASPVTPSGYVPPAGGARKASLTGSKRTIAVVGGIAVLALAVGGVILTVSGTSSSPTVTLAPYPNQPADTWEIDSRDFTSDGSAVNVSGVVAGHLIMTSRATGEFLPRFATGYDIAAQEVAWEVELGNFQVTCNHHDAGSVVFCHSDGELIALDALTGDELGRFGSHLPESYQSMIVGPDDTVSVLYVSEHSRGVDVEVSQLDSQADELWTQQVDVPPDAYYFAMSAGTAPGEVLVTAESDHYADAWLVSDRRVEDLVARGNTVKFAHGYRIEGQIADSGLTVKDLKGERLLDLANATLITESLADAGPGAPAILKDAADRYVSGWDLTTGERVWSSPMPEGTGIYLVTAQAVILSGDGRIRALDRRTGDRLWNFSRPEYLTWEIHTDGSRAIFFDEDELVAVDLMTGDEAWRLRARQHGDESVNLREIGGRLALVADDRLTVFEP